MREDGLTESTFEEVNDVFVCAYKWQSTKPNNGVRVTNVLATTAIFLYHVLHLRLL